MRGSIGLLTTGSSDGRHLPEGTLTGQSRIPGYTRRPSRAGHGPSHGALTAWPTITRPPSALEILTGCSSSNGSPSRGNVSRRQWLRARRWLQARPQRFAAGSMRVGARSAGANTGMHVVPARDPTHGKIAPGTKGDQQSGVGAQYAPTSWYRLKHLNACEPAGLIRTIVELSH